MELLPDNLETIEITNDVGEKTQHILDKDMIQAVNAALAIGRPLLIWGEPGIGKSQLAKAVAKQLKRAFLHFVADAKTESRDLLWHFDAVARLAEAQIYKATNDAEKCTDNPMAIEKFIVPGCLWWALNWQTAEIQASYCKRKSPVVDECCSHKNGTVLLIDEIDKADSDVPNGLLEALGSSRFHPQGLDVAVECKGIKPLVIITTNEERSLPDAFVRRCLALHLAFPKDGQEDFLVQRARQNFPDLDEKLVLLEAAKMLLEDRAHAVKNNLYPLPGQAEYFDLLRGVRKLSQHNKIPAEDYIKQLRRYTYQKHSGFHLSQHS